MLLNVGLTWMIDILYFSLIYTDSFGLSKKLQGFSPVNLLLNVLIEDFNRWRFNEFSELDQEKCNTHYVSFLNFYKYLVLISITQCCSVGFGFTTQPFYICDDNMTTCWYYILYFTTKVYTTLCTYTHTPVDEY